MFTNLKYRYIILPNATENWHTILYDLHVVSRLWYIATSGPFCKDASHLTGNGMLQILS